MRWSRNHLYVLCALIGWLHLPNNVWASLENSDLVNAAARGNLSQVKELLSASGKNYEIRDKDMALITAAQNGHENIVKFLLASGANANAKADKGYTALMFAAQDDRLGVVHC
mgnify:CR=1 FL=1